MSPLSLPYEARSALSRAAGARGVEFGSLAEVVAWAETNLGFDFTCGPRTPGAGNAGRARHRVAIDPHTGNCTPDPTPKQQEKADAVHMLWALTSTEPAACQQISRPFKDWVGNVHPGPRAPWPKGGATNARIANLRTVVRVVQFIDEGLDLHANEAWLRIGAHPQNVRHARALLAEEGLANVEAELCHHLARVTGVEWNALRGKRAETSWGWLNKATDQWVRSARPGRFLRD